MTVSTSRRGFLRGASAMSFLGGAGLLSAMTAGRAFAADTTGYKALVGVFLKGGLDHWDTVLPRDAESHAELANIRSSLFSSYSNRDGSRDRENILPLNLQNADAFGGRQFGLPQELAPLQALFNQGRAAVVGNVGPLIENATRSQIDAGSVRTPARLFSHNDQQSTWMSGAAEGARLGWGGALADAIIQSNGAINPAYVSIGTNTSDVFLNGAVTPPFPIQNGGPRSYEYLDREYYLGGYDDADRARALIEEHLRGEGVSSDNLFTRDYIAANGRALDTIGPFQDAYENQQPLQTVFPENRLGGELRTVAESINIRNDIGAVRQIFYTQTGGFDTHSNQAGDLPNRLSEVASAIAAFMSALEEMGVADQVTLFTMSDFGRTLIINGDGTDHAWGAHHFVVGGAVNGAQIYGDMPTYEYEGEAFTGRNGRNIPGVSVDQYAATLGRWFGLDTGELAAIFPNLGNFDDPYLGFV